MSASEKKMKPLDDEVKRLDAEIARLQAERAGVLRARALMGDQPMLPDTGRKRSPNIKPLILDTMNSAGVAVAMSAEVSEIVRREVPSVAKDTVGSVLSRLKADGALVYDGARYYETRFGPKAVVG